MVKIKSILFPVDFSENCHKVLPYVQTMVQTQQAELHLIYVVQDVDGYAQMYVPLPSIGNLAHDIAEGAKKKMQQFVEANLADLKEVQTHIIIGNAAKDIVDMAQELEADMIIMGTHGRKGVEYAYFGSVAEKVVRTAPCPVLTVRG